MASSPAFLAALAAQRLQLASAPPQQQPSSRPTHTHLPGFIYDAVLNRHFPIGAVRNVSSSSSSSSLHQSLITHHPMARSTALLARESGSMSNKTFAQALCTRALASLRPQAPLQLTSFSPLSQFYFTGLISITSDNMQLAAGSVNGALCILAAPTSSPPPPPIPLPTLSASWLFTDLTRSHNINATTDVGPITALSWSPTSSEQTRSSQLCVAALGARGATGGVRVFSENGNILSELVARDAWAAGWVLGSSGESLALAGLKGRVSACTTISPTMRVVQEWRARPDVDVVALGEHTSPSAFAHTMTLIGTRDGNIFQWDLREEGGGKGTNTKTKPLFKLPSSPVALIPIGSTAPFAFLAADTHETANIYDLRRLTTHISRLIGYRNSPLRRGVTVSSGGYIAAAQTDNMGVRVWEPPRHMNTRVIFEASKSSNNLINGDVTAVAFLNSRAAMHASKSTMMTMPTTTTTMPMTTRAWPSLILAESTNVLRILSPPWS
jgi:hypothetical protein